MIDSKEISVVVQGPINNKETPKCLKSIRKFLPDAEIILSTWDDENVNGLDFDDLVISHPPFAPELVLYKSGWVYNNMNRQLLSTQEGLKKVNRKYTLKFRTDLILTTDKFLNWFDKFPARIEDYKLFKRKVLIGSVYSRFQFKAEDTTFFMPFHFADWWYFGLTEDIKTFFMDTPLVDEPAFSNYFKDKNVICPFGKAKHKFAPEQYFGYECFHRNFPDINMKDAADYDDELIEKSRICTVNNFIILEHSQTGIYMKKYAFSEHEVLLGNAYIDLYTFYRYENEYKKYCDSNYEVTTKLLFGGNKKLWKSYVKLCRHWDALIRKNNTFVNRLEQIFIGLPFALVRFITKYTKAILKGEV